MVRAIKVSLDVGREVRGLLKRKKIYEDKYIPFKTNEHIILPLRTKNLDFEYELKKITKKYEIIDYDLKKNSRTRSFRRELQKILPKDLFEFASRAYEQIGHIGIITIFKDMEPYEDEIAKALIETNKGIKSVFKKVSKHSGKNRIQSYYQLLGDESSKTIHKENGVEIELDIEKVYFSARTANERKRIYSLIKDNEDVLVLFCGCAPYPLTIAKNTNAKKIVGVELNKDAYEYGLKNIKRNDFSQISLICGDAKDEIKNMNEHFDRIIMPHPTKADYFLQDALSVLKDNGVIHMYLFSKPEKLDYVEDKIETMSRNKGFRVKRINVIELLHISSSVKKYCFDIYLNKLK